MTDQNVVANLNASYMYSANLTQTLIAFLEAMLIFDGRMTLNAAYAAVIFVSTFVPPSGVFGYFGPNEKLWETIIATLGCGIVGIIGWDKGFGKHALKGFVLSTSSMAVTDEFYTLILSSGVNVQNNALRAMYPTANAANRAFLG